MIKKHKWKTTNVFYIFFHFSSLTLWFLKLKKSLKISLIFVRFCIWNSICLDCVWDNSITNARFPNPLNSCPKMISAWNKCLANHFEGCFAGFSESVLRLGARSPIFFHLKRGTFAKSTPFQVTKNGTSSARILERTPKTPRKTPQNDWLDVCVMHLSFLGKNWADLEILHFLADFGTVSKKWIWPEGNPKMTVGSSFLAYWPPIWSYQNILGAPEDFKMFTHP